MLLCNEKVLNDKVFFSVSFTNGINVKPSAGRQGSQRRYDDQITSLTTQSTISCGNTVSVLPTPPL